MPLKHRFSLGHVVSTPGAVEAFSRTAEMFLTYLARHAGGDWGDLDREDKALNDQAVTHGGRLVSAYRLCDQTKIWIITEADRSVTTFLLPEEY
jgi:hypothetical protein